MKNKLNGSDYLQDAMFQKFLQEHITETEEQHKKIIADTQVFNVKHKITTEVVLKRDTFARLKERGLMSVKGIIAEAEKILQKKSELVSVERKFLGNMLSSAMSKTIIYYEEHPTIIQRVKNIVGKW